MSARSRYIECVAEDSTAGSYQMMPPTQKPWKVRGLTHGKTGSTTTYVTIALTKEQAAKLTEDWTKMGLFGRHGRIETKAAA